MSKRSDKMYKDGPTVGEDEDGKKVVKKGGRTETEAGKEAAKTDEGIEGMQEHEKAAIEMHAKHSKERLALHHKHEVEHHDLHAKQLKEGSAAEEKGESKKVEAEEKSKGVE